MKNGLNVVLFVLFLVGFCQSAELLVPADYPTIQAAVDAAQDGDVVIVADGVYTGDGNRNITIQKSVTIKSQHGASRCIIDCAGTEDDPATGFLLADYYPESQIIQVAITGFTVRNGYYTKGGAISIGSSFETDIINCRLVNNVAANSSSLDGLGLIPLALLLDAGCGGAVRCEGQTTLINCVIEGNQAEKGGGIYCGPYTKILHCTITGNQAGKQGGGIFYEVSETTDPGNEKSELVNSIVWDNWAEHGPQLALSDDMLLDTVRSNLTYYGDNPGVVPFPPAQQGSIEYTGVQTDLAINGPDFFVLDNDIDTVFTRIGDFAIDAEGYLVDPDTGRYVRRLPDVGEVKGFQTPGDLRIFVPFDYTEPASATSVIEFTGNLRAGCFPSDATTNQLTANIAFTVNSGASPASATTYISDLDQWIKPLGIGNIGQIDIFGYQSDGMTPIQAWVTWVGTCPGVGPTMQDILDQISAAFPNDTATLNADGKIVLTSDTPGYSRTMITEMHYFPAGADDLTIPTYFDYTTIGANDSKSFMTTIFDNIGEQHVLTGTFVKTDAANTWDLVIHDISGERSADWDTYDINSSSSLNRRISGIEFNIDGSFKGLNNVAEQAEFSVQFDNDPSITQMISLNFGRPGEFYGITQFASEQSSAYVMMQNGYGDGGISSLIFQHDGTVIFSLTNGTIQIGARIATAVFPHPNYLSIIENDCYLDNSRSGQAQIGPVQGTIMGKFLEIRPETIVLTGTPMIVDHSVVQEGLKEVSFEDALSLRGVSWNEVYQSNPCFTRPGQWVDHSDGTVSWKRGNYRLLPYSKYIDASILYLQSGLPEHDIAGNDRVVTFKEDTGDMISGSGLQVVLPNPTTIKSDIVANLRSQVGLPDLTSQIIINPGVITPNPATINPDLLGKSMADLGAYESSWRPVEASVQIVPNTIEDISVWQILQNTIQGITESPFDTKWAYVMLHVPTSEFENGVVNTKQIGLTTETGLRPTWTYAFEKKRFGTVCIVGVFDYHEFVKSVRKSLHLTRSQRDVDMDHTLGLWIDIGQGAFLKTSGLVHYIRPESNGSALSSGMPALQLQQLQN